MNPDPFTLPFGDPDLPQPDLLLADFEAACVPDTGVVSRSIALAMEDSGFPVALPDILPLAGMPVRVQLAELVAVNAGLTLEEAFEISTRIEARVSERLWRILDRGARLRPTPGAEDAFAALQSEGIRVGLDSMLPSELTSRILEGLGWLRSGLVDHVMCAQEVEAPRPSPDLILAATGSWGCGGPGRLAKLCGSRLDVLAAVAAGCRWVFALDRTPGPTGGPLSEGVTFRRIGDFGNLPEHLLGWVLR